MYPPQVTVDHQAGRFQFYPSSGTMRCEAHDGEAWCMHRADLIRERIDQLFLWHFDTLQGEMLEIKIAVPIFPTAGIWTPVELSGTYESRMFRVDVDSQPIPPNMPSSYVCTITPGEGIQDIRFTLIEYMKMTPGWDTAHCAAGHHGIVAQRKWMEKNDRVQSGTNVNALLPEQYNIWLTGWCIYCRDNETDFGDLIPPVQNTGVWGNNR